MLLAASYVTQTLEEVVDKDELIWEPIDGWVLSWLVLVAAITPAMRDLSMVMVLPTSDKVN